MKTYELSPDAVPAECPASLMGICNLSLCRVGKSSVDDFEARFGLPRKRPHNPKAPKKPLRAEHAHRLPGGSNSRSVETRRPRTRPRVHTRGVSGEREAVRPASRFSGD